MFFFLFEMFQNQTQTSSILTTFSFNCDRSWNDKEINLINSGLWYLSFQISLHHRKNYLFYFLVGMFQLMDSFFLSHECFSTIWNGTVFQSKITMFNMWIHLFQCDFLPTAIGFVFTIHFQLSIQIHEIFCWPFFLFNMNWTTTLWTSVLSCISPIAYTTLRDNEEKKIVITKGRHWIFYNKNYLTKHVFTFNYNWFLEYQSANWT